MMNMKTISIFILLIYWSIIIFAPLISKDIQMSHVEINKIELKDIKFRNV
jgi:hypothetical protein